VGAEFGTWHHGLIARFWAEFLTAEPEERAYFRDVIQKFGEPALDLGCGTGRMLLPLLADGLDVDGSDISADMIALAREAAVDGGFEPRLTVQPIHELELGRTYRTIFMCGVFGLGGRRDYDREALKRAHRHLEPGGALVIANHHLPYDHDEPGEWPNEGDRRTASDGDEIETLFRVCALDRIDQRTTYQMRARLWHEGAIVKEEEYSLDINLYFVQEVVRMLEDAGFHDIEVQGGYTGRPATSGDEVVAFVARKP
jgi:SAM-dependent methyltransferase